MKILKKIEFIQLILAGQLVPIIFYFTYYIPPSLYGYKDYIYFFILFLLLILFFCFWNRKKLTSLVRIKIISLSILTLCSFSFMIFVYTYNSSTIIWPKNHKAIQIGFGTCEFSLTDEARNMIISSPDEQISKEKLLDWIGWKKENINKIWKQNWINIASIILAILYFSTMILSTIGWGILMVFIYIEKP